MLSLPQYSTCYNRTYHLWEAEVTGNLEGVTVLSLYENDTYTTLS